MKAVKSEVYCLSPDHPNNNANKNDDKENRDNERQNVYNGDNNHGVWHVTSISKIANEWTNKT